MKTFSRITFVAVVILYSLLLYSCKKDDDNNTEEIPACIVYGTITDYETGNPIANAMVELDNDQSILTGMDGYYQFNGIIVGDHSLSCIKNGYDYYSYGVSFDYNGQKVRRDVQLIVW